MPDIRYKRVGYVALNTTDRARSVAFQRDTMGLSLRMPPGAEVGASILSGGNSACEVAFYEGPVPGLRRVAFEIESERSLENARAHLAALGLSTTAVGAAELGAFSQRAAFRFAEPRTGLNIELFVSSGAIPPPSPYESPVTNIRQLGHIVVYATDAPALTAFFLGELNFRASDFIGEAAFLRCFPNPFHHSFAVVPGNENRLNHVNFLVRDLDDVGRALYRLKAQRVPIVFGPGRHPPSGSVFLYFTDPDGYTFEFSTGMEEFPEDDPRLPRRLPLTAESLDYWGSDRAAEYGQVGPFTATP
jgi:2,3-dihydroxy-p-cumate/2,3-dihydroxybenzoate 3,4-dioxygenase